MYKISFVALVLSIWITATASCLDSLLTSSSVSNLFRTLRLG